MERVNQKKREKDEIKGKIDKNLEKFEEIKNQESLKMLALKQNLQELAEKNKKLSQELEESQRNCVTARIGFEKEINSWKKKHEMIDAEIKNLILKSKD
jgi:diphthamide biosynthesis methyltransferase